MTMEALCGFAGPYRLSVEVVLPEIVIEGEIFTGEYVFTNISGVPFPGIHTGMNVGWPEIQGALTVYDPTDIGPLQNGEPQRFPLTHTPVTSGMTVFTVALQHNHAVDGILVDFILLDDRIIRDGQLVAAVSVKSREVIVIENLIVSLNKSSKIQDFLARV